MQTQLFQNFDTFDHLATLREYVPLLDQVINSDVPLDSSPTTQTLLSNFFQKCLIELKECKATMSLQEDTIQSATEELIRLREENNNLTDANQGFARQIGNLQNYLHEADTITTNLRSEVNQLRQENRVLGELCEHAEFPSRDESSRILSAQFDFSVARDKELDPGSEKLDHESIVEVLQQKENMIKHLTHNLEELCDYREKYNQLLKETEAHKTLKEHVERLQEELNTVKEENRKLLNKSPEIYLRRLRSCEGVDNSDKVQGAPVDNDNLWNLLNSKDDDGQNKNFLARKSLTLASPSKENVDLKKQSLLMETILFNSKKSPNPFQKKNSEKKLNSPHLQRNMALLNFGGIVKNSSKPLVNSLVDAASESDLGENLKKQSKNNIESCSSVYSSKEPHSSRKEKMNNSARKHDDRVYLRETSFEIHNTSRNSEELCFDELLSWEEGDFPRLNTSNMTCNSPKIESCVAENWIAGFESATITKDLLSKDLNFKIHPQTTSHNEQEADRHKEECNNISRENKNVPCQEQTEKNQEAISRLPPKIPTKNIEKNKTVQKKGQSGLIHTARDQIKFKENTTQTDKIDVPCTDNAKKVDLKAVNTSVVGTQNNTWKSVVTLVTLLLSLIFIFVSSREGVINREL